MAPATSTTRQNCGYCSRDVNAHTHAESLRCLLRLDPPALTGNHLPAADHPPTGDRRRDGIPDGLSLAGWTF